MCLTWNIPHSVICDQPPSVLAAQVSSSLAIRWVPIVRNTVGALITLPSLHKADSRLTARLPGRWASLGGWPVPDLRLWPQL